VINRPAWPSRAVLARFPSSVGYPTTFMQLLKVAPFIVGFIVLSWVLTIVVSKPDYGYESRFFFHIPDVTRDFEKSFSSLFTAPFLNRGPQQILYVTVILLSFGVLIESREGSRRTAFLFFVSAGTGALFAAIILHIIYPGMINHPALSEAWSGAWSGGRAGAFGLAGAFAARRQRAWYWMAFFILWESLVATFRLRNYTPAFHFGALFAGFLITRYLLRPRELESIERASSPA
jgi:membrane associated rhomboid family serine protease